MADGPRILVLAGSTRRGSFNRKLARLGAAAAREAGGRVTELDLREHPLPLYDGDLEAQGGLPEEAMKLKGIFLEHDALLIASPEYNSGISGVLKNAIDWVSRPVQGQPPLAAFRGKVAGLMSASTGVMGGLRGLAQLRSILSNINVLVIPEQLTVSKAAEAFAENGSLKDQAHGERLAKVAARVVEVAGRLR